MCSFRRFVSAERVADGEREGEEKDGVCYERRGEGSAADEQTD